MPEWLGWLLWGVFVACFAISIFFMTISIISLVLKCLSVLRSETSTTIHVPAMTNSPSYGLRVLKPTPTPIKDDGVKLGTLTGYRGFDAERAVSGRWVLHSLSMGSPWLPGEVAEARCGIHICDDDLVPEANPKHDPACGIYAYKYLDPLRHSTGIVAEVELWGRIVEHEYGYRAQYARITALYRTADLIDQIAKDYNVEVRPWEPSESPSERSSTGLSQSQWRLQAAKLLLQHTHQSGNLPASQPPPDNNESKD